MKTFDVQLRDFHEEVSPAICIEPTWEESEISANIIASQRIGIIFPRTGDGRGFSLARRIRGPLAYKGRLIALGPLLPDQAGMLHRVGFDAIDAQACSSIETWRRCLQHAPLSYQAAVRDGTRQV